MRWAGFSSLNVVLLCIRSIKTESFLKMRKIKGPWQVRLCDHHKAKQFQLFLIAKWPPF